MGDSSKPSWGGANAGVEGVASRLHQLRMVSRQLDCKGIASSLAGVSSGNDSISGTAFIGKKSRTTVGWAGEGLDRMSGSDKGGRNMSPTTLRLDDDGAAIPVTSSPRTSPQRPGTNTQRGTRSNRGRWRGDPRRGRAYRKLWEQVTKVGSGEDLGDGRFGFSEMSVEDIVRLVQTLPAESAVGPAVSHALCYLDSRAAAALLKELAKVGRSQRAMELFDWLRGLDGGHELAALCDVYTYTTIISLCGAQKELRRALELVAEQRSRGIQCNVHTYSALMNVCIKSGELELALDVFKQMRTEGCKPNVVTYNTLIDVYGKLGQWRKASEVLVTIKNEGLEPEIRSYNTALIACNMCNQPLEALKVFEQIINSGLQPSATTYTALISAYGKAGMHKNAFEAYDKMVARKMDRTTITYTALMTCCEKSGNWELGLQFLSNMQKEGCEPSTGIFNSLIAAMCEAGEWQQANKVFEQMNVYSCKPDINTFMLLLNVFDRCGEWSQVAKLFDGVMRMGIRPDPTFYHAVIDILWCSGVTRAQIKAAQVYNFAVKHGRARPTLQSTLESGILQVLVQPMKLGVAVIGLHKWMLDLRVQVDMDATCLLDCEVAVMISRGRNSRDPACKRLKEALVGMFEGIGAPLSLQEDDRASPKLQCSGYSFRTWLQDSESFAKVTSLVCCNGEENMSRAGNPDLQLSIDQKFKEAYEVITRFESSHRLDYQAMGDDYLSARSNLVAIAEDIGQRLRLRNETVHDAVLLMDRVMSTGARFEEGVSTAVVAALIRLASEASECHSSIPTSHQMDILVNFPVGSIQELEFQIKATLGQDTSAISALRVARLYLEWLGYEATSEWSAPAIVYLQSLLRAALFSPSFLNFRPSVVAAAMLYHDRQMRGWVPFWPSGLALITGYRDLTSPEMRGAIHAVAELDKSRKSPRSRILALSL